MSVDRYRIEQPPLRLVDQHIVWHYIIQLTIRLFVQLFCLIFSAGFFVLF